MLQILVAIAMAAPFIALIILLARKSPHDGLPEVDNWLARLTAILAVGIFIALCIWVSATCAGGGTCGSSGDETLILPFLASPLALWALPKLHRWITRG